MSKIICDISNQQNYPFSLPDLPYKASDFLNLSEESFEYHHQKHHMAYVKVLNDIVKDKVVLQSKNLEDIIHNSSAKSQDANSKLFNQSSQVWNHTFFWHSINPNDKKDSLKGKLLEQINKDFGSIDKFNEQFIQKGLSQFGSGWVWIVYSENKIKIVTTPNAEPAFLYDNTYPLAVCDVWEHAYYIDYRNDRAKFLHNYVAELIDWSFVAKRYEYCAK